MSSLKTDVSALHPSTPMGPLLLGKRAVAHAYPDRVLWELHQRTGIGEAPLPLPGLPAPDASERQRIVCGAKPVPPLPAVGCEQVLFCSGEHFAVLQGDVTRQPVSIVHNLDPRDATAASKLVDALQALCAAHAAGAQEHLVLELPAACDPHSAPSLFNRLLPRLAKASGAREVRYEGSSLDSHATTAFVQELRARLDHVTTREGAQAVRNVAYEQSKWAGRRGLPALEGTWRRLANEALAFACKLPAAPSAPPVILGVSAARELSDSVALSLQGKGGACRGEHDFRATAPDVVLRTDVEGRDVAIVASMRGAPGSGEASEQAPGNMVEALLLAQSAREAGARHVTIIQAYQMNGRSDIEEHTASGSHIGSYAALVARWFDAVKCDAAVLLECHDRHTPIYWSSVRHAHAQALDGINLLVDDLWRDLSVEDQGRTVLAIPDAGGAKRAKELRKRFARVVTGEKERTNHGGDAKLRRLEGNAINAEDTVVLTDDEVSSGSTLAQTLQRLRAQGAKQLHTLVVHNNFALDALERNIKLAWLRDSGATTQRYSDSHAMGAVVNSYDELLRLGGTPAQNAAAVREFCAARQITTPPQALFKDLAKSVKVVPLAPALAQAVVAAQPPRR